MAARTLQWILLATSLALGACSESRGGASAGAPAAGLPTAQKIDAVPMGHIAGMTDSAALARSTASPYQGNAQAIAEGHALYVRMNCAGCHAYNATGSMGPSLVDDYWRYGGYPVQIYKSIHDGRAQGMPAWGVALPPQEIWKIVAYIQSLGGTYPVGGPPHQLQRPEQVAPEVQASIGHGSAPWAPARVPPRVAPTSAPAPPPRPAAPAAPTPPAHKPADADSP